jgi:biotin carboxylase
MPEGSRPVAAIVDRYTCSEHLLAAFRRLGVDVVQVQYRPETTPAIPGLPYVAQVVGDDGAAVAAELAAYRPFAVVPGQEPDVPFADELSERMGLPTNGAKLSRARRDKHEMIETLRRAGVRSAEQFKSDDADDIVAWAERAGRFPVVVKPLTSAATDGVAICSDIEQVRKQAEALLGTSTIFEDANTEVLVQEYLDGPEHIVDTVSCEGRRYTCGVWRYQKRLLGVHNIYDRHVLLPPDAAPVPDLIAYLDDALDALGIRYGATHAEVIVTAAGPTLVEVGARTNGAMYPAYDDAVLGANQADVTALAYFRPEEFLERYADRTYTRNRHALVCMTATELEGTIQAIDQTAVAEIERLPSVHTLLVTEKVGARIRPTVDLHSSTMKVFMAGDSAEQVDRDYRRLQELKDRVYQLG